MKEYPYVWHGFEFDLLGGKGEEPKMLRWYSCPVWELSANAAAAFGDVCAFALLVPIWFPIPELSASLSAIPLEPFVSLLGIFLLAPAFWLGKPKCSTGEKPPHLVAESLLRIVWSCCGLAGWIGIFCLGMEQSGCQISILHWVGTLVDACFLGALGILAGIIGGNRIIGCGIPSLYYLLNMILGENYFGKFDLFSMTRESYHEKIWLAAAASLFLIVAVQLRTFLWKIRGSCFLKI